MSRTPLADPELLAAAKAAAGKAYAPYSGFNVGAAIRSKQGHVYSGCNVENAAYPIGGCAERAALAMAVLAEGDQFQLDSALVFAIKSDGTPAAAPPCGACRQALAEFGPQASVDFLHTDNQWLRVNVAELLPYGFVLTRP